MRSLNQAAMILALCGAATITYAKTIDYTPDITSGQYWDTHHIAVVRITGIRNENDQPDSVSWQVEARFSDDGVESLQTVPLSHLWFGPDKDALPSIAAGDRFVIYYSREGPSEIALTPLPDHSDSRVLAGLRTISTLRENPADTQAYLNAVLERDPDVARYSLRHLLAQTGTLQADASYLGKLHRLRDDASHETGDRILAGRLADRLDGGDISNTEYSWLQIALANSQNTDWKTLTPYVDRLLEFPDKRAETVSFLARLASDPAVPQPVRIAAYGGFPDPRLFRFDAPDADSIQLYKACLTLLSDPEPTMRRAGAALLHNITVRVSRPDFLETSRKALAEALAAEPDEMTQFHLTRFLNLLSN